MPKQKTPKINKNILILYAVLGILVFTCLALVLIYNCTVAKSPSISLGSLTYKIENDKAVKRDDVAVNDLRAFLEATAAHEGCTKQDPAYEHVIASTKDETQVFMKYGCGAADSPIYAIKKDGVWKTISPTDHFDLLGIPECGYLAENSISREIAPVCSDGSITAPQYTVR